MSAPEHTVIYRSDYRAIRAYEETLRPLYSRLSLWSIDYHIDHKKANFRRIREDEAQLHTSQSNEEFYEMVEKFHFSLVDYQDLSPAKKVSFHARTLLYLSLDTINACKEKVMSVSSAILNGCNYLAHYTR